MPATTSLQHRLRTDPNLDDGALIGPVQPMRWMSNLFRLAMLEESDRQAVEQGLEPRHRAEIRRLRRLSMAPDVGDYYPVGGDTDEPISTEQARNIVESFRAHQASLNRRTPVEVFDRLEPDNPYDVFDDELDDELDDDFEDEYSEQESHDDPEVAYPEDFEADIAPTPNPFISSSLHPFIETHAAGPKPSANRLTPSAYLLATVLAALLLLAAAWFAKASVRPPPPHSASAHITTTCKGVPSAVPRHDLDLGSGTRSVDAAHVARIVRPVSVERG